MNKVPQFEPITRMQTKPTEILAMLDAGPVILAQRSKAAAVLVSVAQWDKLMERLEDQADIIDALQMKLDMARGEVEVETFTADQLNELIGVGDRVPA
ncbi:MAG: type II toxin-antitoxin system prevent-host-death family antitoxin [Caldilinea sp. CFX5]|nr:type II toxin-antitoxin system prevent-host-death family antitoxin [Caldilinea sp. CFX5]